MDSWSGRHERSFALAGPARSAAQRLHAGVRASKVALARVWDIAIFEPPVERVFARKCSATAVCGARVCCLLLLIAFQLEELLLLLLLQG